MEPLVDEGVFDTSSLIIALVGAVLWFINRWLLTWALTTPVLRET